MKEIAFESEKKAPNMLVRFSESTDRELRDIAVREDVTLAATIRTMTSLGLEVYRKSKEAAVKKQIEDRSNIEEDVRGMDG